MQKAWNIISVIAIVGLIVWVVLLLMANSKWRALVNNPPVPLIPNTPVNPSTNSDTSQISNSENQPSTDTGRSVTAQEWWEGFKNSAKEVKLDVTFQ